MPWLYGLGAFLLMAIVFVVWRYTSVARGMRQAAARVERELEPFLERLEAGHEIRAAEVAALASHAHLRPPLYTVLKHHERLDLFPCEHRTIEAQAASELAFWVMHPNELKEPPEKIELVESSTRQLPAGAAQFLVLRFRMPKEHRAAEDGWLLGVAGPFFARHIPYDGCSPFSRIGDRYGEVQPDELIDWFVEMARRKGAPWMRADFQPGSVQRSML